VVKKAVGAVLKIVHAHTVSEGDLPDYAQQREHKETYGIVQKAKFVLLSPLDVHAIFSKVRMEV
jgi:hypothetical protein